MLFAVIAFQYPNWNYWSSGYEPLKSTYGYGISSKNRNGCEYFMQKRLIDLAVNLKSDRMENMDIKSPQWRRQFWVLWIWHEEFFPSPEIKIQLLVLRKRNALRDEIYTYLISETTETLNTWWTRSYVQDKKPRMGKPDYIQYVHGIIYSRVVTYSSPQDFPYSRRKTEKWSGGQVYKYCRVGTGTHALNKYFLTCLSAYLQ